MKKLFTILFLFVSFIALSQNNGINFQGVGRNSSGTVLASTKISLRFSVIQSSETGTVEYIESKHHVAGNYKDGVRQAVEAGLNVRTDFDMPDKSPIKGRIQQST